MLTPDQNRSLDLYLYRREYTNLGGKKPKNEFAKQEKLKDKAESVLDEALKKIEGD